MQKKYRNIEISLVTLSIIYRYVYGRNMSSDFFSRRHKQSYYKD